MMRCDPVRTSAVVTKNRAIAERTRAYGGAGAGRGLVGATAMKLHLIAVHLESKCAGGSDLRR